MTWRIFGRARFFDFPDQLLDLFPLALAHVEETDSHVMRVVNGLGNASQAEGQTGKMELRLDPRVNTHRKRAVGPDMAAVRAEVQNAPMKLRSHINEKDGGIGIDAVARLLSPFAAG